MLTVNVTFVPSSLTDVGVATVMSGGESSLVMVPIAWASVTVGSVSSARSVVAVRMSTVNVSSFSSVLSPLTTTLSVWLVTPAANAREPSVSV